MSDSPDKLDELLQRGFRYACSLTHDDELARDLLQDACLSISRNDGPWHPGYLFASVRNRYVDWLRRKRHVRIQPLDDLDGDPAAPSVTASSSDGPNLIASAEEVERVLGTLRAAEREALYLNAVESYSADEIAALTGRPRNTILSLIHRAKLALRERLAPSQQEDPSCRTP